MALELNLIKNTNETLQGTLGKYYARVEYKGTIGVRELADHMHHHNTAFSKGIITGVLGDMVDCIKELVLNGYTVKIDDLGIFKASVDANGLTLEQGSKISAGRGAQRSDEALADNPALQQFAVGDVKMIMQATGATTIENMNNDTRLSFTSKTKAMDIIQLSRIVYMMSALYRDKMNLANEQEQNYNLTRSQETQKAMES